MIKNYLLSQERSPSVNLQLQVKRMGVHKADSKKGNMPN